MALPNLSNWKNWKSDLANVYPGRRVANGVYLLLSITTPRDLDGHCQVNESGTYEGRRIRDQAAVTAVHTVNARARNIRC